MRLINWLAGIRSGRESRRRSNRRYQQGKASPAVSSVMVSHFEILEDRCLLAADFGDAPDTGAGTGSGNYETLLASGGPSHTIDSSQTTLFQGASVDGDDGTLQNVAANNDDTNGTLPDDEDGVLDPANV